MGKVTRKRYGAEFKAKVVLEAIKGELTAGGTICQTQHSSDDDRGLEAAGNRGIGVDVLGQGKRERLRLPKSTR
jgi:hypothetical protein